MFRPLLTVALGAVLCEGLIVANLRADASNTVNLASTSQGSGSTVETRKLTPFTHVAYIPGGADLSTIRFVSARTVSIPTEIRYTTDTRYCQEAAFRDPGGSAYCPSASAVARELAYEVTYSFNGPPAPSDEYANGHFVFQVYFRPDELTEDMRKALPTHKQKRADTAGFFAVRTYRESVQQVMVNESQSRFCAGSFVEGLWTYNDAGCKDRIRYKTVAGPSDSISVRVDPILPNGQVVSANNHSSQDSGPKK